MANRDIILFGAGKEGMHALNEYAERVKYFCDNNKSGCEIKGITVISFQELKSIANDYEIVITPSRSKIQYDIARQLKRENINFTVYRSGKSQQPVQTLRIFGTVDNLDFLINDKGVEPWRFRAEITSDMFRQMFKKYDSYYKDQRIDIAVYWGDDVLEAYRISQIEGWSHIFAYSTMDIFKDVVIPIPDYRSYYRTDSSYFQESESACHEASMTKWSDKRIYWRGNLETSIEREWLYILSKKYPDILYADGTDGYTGGAQYLPMTEQAKYKYLLDIRGNGWTDRIKILLRLGRPVFIVDRPYKEWYFDDLIPGEHYISVKEDLSDLIEKYNSLDTDSSEYDRIVKNASEFVNNHLSPKCVMDYLHKVTMDYLRCS